MALQGVGMLKTLQKKRLCRVKASLLAYFRAAVFAALFVAASDVMAQEQVPSLIGKWERLSEMVHIEIQPDETVGDEGDSQRYYAVVTRADWSPGRVGRKIYQNLVYDGKRRWIGQEVDDKGKARKIRLTMRKDGYLHTTSYLDGRKRIRWTPILTD